MAPVAPSAPPPDLAPDPDPDLDLAPDPDQAPLT